MKIIITENADAFDREGALYFTRQALKKPDSTFAIATGNTTRNIYILAAELHKELKVDYSSCKTSNLDEYAGISAEDEKSCRFRIDELILKRINIKSENTYVPNGLANPVEKELEIFRNRIESFGGIDLMILSIGANGHIAFNEPGTPFSSSYRIAPISENTRKDKAIFFGGQDKVPKFGISMGIRDIMMSREILLVAKGRSKAEAICGIINGPMTVDLPASVLQVHPAVTVLIDRDAASLLTPKES